MNTLKPYRIDILSCTCGSAEAFRQLSPKPTPRTLSHGSYDPYNTTRAITLMKSLLPTVNQAYYALQGEERQREILHTANINNTMVSSTRNFSKTSTTRPLGFNTMLAESMIHTQTGREIF